MPRFGLLCLLVAGCEAPRDIHPVARPQKVVAGTPTAVACTASAAQHVSAPVVISASARTLHSSGLRWVDSDEQVYEVADDPRTPLRLGAAKKLGSVWDERYSYRLNCYGDCDAGDRSDAFSPLMAIEREDRITGDVTRLNHGTHPAGHLVLLGDYVYWISFAHSCQGGVWRVPRDGGEQELIETARDDWQPRYDELRGYANGLIAEDGMRVAWIPANGVLPRMLSPLDVSALIAARREAVYDGDSFYELNEYRAATFITRVSPSGVSRTIAGPIDSARELTTFGDQLYFASGDALWTAPKAGGCPQRLLESRCVAPEEVTGIWGQASGLIWSCGEKYTVLPGVLYFAEWNQDT